MNQNKVFQNAKWIIGCKILQSLLNLAIGMLSARYLGPSNYGLISYAASVVGFVVPVMQLDMRSTLVREYIEREPREGAVLGTSLVMSMVSGMACMIAVAGFVTVANPGEPLTLAVAVLYSISLPLQAMELTQYWFQAKLLSKFPSLTMLGAYLVSSVYKIFLLSTGKGVCWFAVAHAIEYIITGSALLLIYWKQGNSKLSFSFPLAKELFARSKYYIISGLMGMVFASTDRVMLKLMVGEAENGIYSAAVVSAGAVNFVYAAIIDSARPAILGCKKENRDAYENRLAGLYSVITYLALLESIFVTIFAEPIVWVLYGNEYWAAVPVLRIVVWYIAFSYMGTVRNIWILAENKQSLLWIINLSGAVMNVLLNAMLIPLWGACGAATASVLTQFLTNVVIGFLLKPIRQNNKLLIKGLNPGTLLRIIREHKN